MATSIEVNKQSVKELLESGKKNAFVIPEYQRPYAWKEEHIVTLFNDLKEFTENQQEKDDEEEGSYFLGTIVSFENDKGEQEIIDGQQRLTSLFLLLRAIYSKLQTNDTKSKEEKNFIGQIEPTIWKQDKMTGSVDYSKVLMSSKVLNNEGNTILKNILETGKTEEENKDNYSQNYLTFVNLIEDLSKEKPMFIYEFIYSVLHRAIMLPIKADNQETALTIFSTLNDRGLPLSDADIFKAKIYNKLDEQAKEVFIKQWQDIETRANNCDESMQQLFYYYMFYLRAKENDRKTTTPGLRKYFSQNKFSRLNDKFLLDSLATILNLWEVVNNRVINEEESWTTNKNILKSLDILKSYPNEFWKYPVTIYYIEHRKKGNFEKHFLIFLKKLIVELITKYLITPTINAVKTDIIKLDVEIMQSELPEFNFKYVNMEDVKNELKTPHRNILRMLLLILAYNRQDDLLKTKWEIEHIFPQNWHPNYHHDKNEEEIKLAIEYIGNKVPFEKKLNISASNGYFDKKKEIYKKSDYVIVRELAMHNSSDWRLDEVRERTIRLVDELIETFNIWNQYNKVIEPSIEDLKKIEEYKEKGWINE